MNKLISIFCFTGVMITMLASVTAQSGGVFVIQKSVIAGGGGQATAGIFTLDATIAQHIAGTKSTGGIFELGGGFWGGGSATAADVTISGRVLTSDGRGLRNASVALIDSLGVRRNVLTSPFGNYSFDTVRVGETYTITVASKRFRFSQRVEHVFGSLTNVDFVGLE